MNKKNVNTLLLRYTDILKNNQPLFEGVPEECTKTEMTEILNEFKDIQEVLLKKNWKTNISLKDDTVIFDIKIPSLDSTNKKSKTKRML